MKETMSEEYLSTRETASRLSVSESTVKNMIRDGIIKAVKKVPGWRSVWMIKASEVERILKAREKGTN